ncbi:LOW QUALITY PROTEIN: ras-related protein Rab-26 [Loxodonta africana]|uniref:LOW QUALITY PROTEIN: ras-related protein Rab-26 n=1 Tax=Loxodonta africana TaxID=9785 RepID=UPI0030CB77AF
MPAPPSWPQQPGRPSLDSGGNFYDIAFKVMLVGDSGVGKTCLLVHFKDRVFLAGIFIATVGINFRVSGVTDWGSVHPASLPSGALVLCFPTVPSFWVRHVFQ